MHSIYTTKTTVAIPFLANSLFLSLSTFFLQTEQSPSQSHYHALPLHSFPLLGNPQCACMCVTMMVSDIIALCCCCCSSTDYSNRL